jgi:hypothetical protein
MAAGEAMLQYRVTKYDPANRDASGSYLVDEWIMIQEIGQEVGGKVLTEAEYQRVESAYARVAVAFMREAGIEVLTVNDLENHGETPLSIGNGSSLDLTRVRQAVRRMLRKHFWCRLLAEEAFVHIGYDYYMYLGVPRECPRAIALAGKLGLFVEPFVSPYHPEPDDDGVERP